MAPTSDTWHETETAEESNKNLLNRKATVERRGSTVALQNNRVWYYLTESFLSTASCGKGITFWLDVLCFLDFWR